MSNFVPVAKVSDLPPGGRMLVELSDGTRVALFNVKGEIYAIEDVCTHDGGPLVEGAFVDEYRVECPRHGAHFDIRTGEALSMPAFEPVDTFQVKVEGDDILLEEL